MAASHTRSDLRRTGAQRFALPLLALLALTALACVGPSATSSQTGFAEQRTFVPSLPVSHPPFDQIEVSWMQRLDQPYVYVDHYGSYTETGTHLPSLLREMRIQGIQADGPPFCLFYDDPAAIPAAELRSRACVPISTPRSPAAPLGYDVLPSRTVAYAFVSRPYPDVPRAYPKILEFMAGMNWVMAGPIRETYIVPPSSANGPREYLCEIQIPTQTKSAPNTAEIGGI